MLAQTFKTHEELGISERLYQALVQVYWLLVDERIPKKLFDMGEIGKPKLKNGHACGSAGCILGWAQAFDKDCLTKGGFMSYTDFCWEDMPKRLEQLFLPDITVDLETLTREQATIALHSYLTTGKDGWKQAIKG